MGVICDSQDKKIHRKRTYTSVDKIRDNTGTNINSVISAQDNLSFRSKDLNSSFHRHKKMKGHGNCQKNNSEIKESEYILNPNNSINQESIACDKYLNKKGKFENGINIEYPSQPRINKNDNESNIFSKGKHKNNMNNMLSYDKKSKNDKPIKIIGCGMDMISEKSANIKGNDDFRKKFLNENNEMENIFFIKNNNNNNNVNKNNIIYVIDDDEESTINNNTSHILNFSTGKDYQEIVKTNLHNKIQLSKYILLLKERKWYEEVIKISNELLTYREKLDNKVFNLHLRKIIKIYEDFNWIVDSIGTYYYNLMFKNDKCINLSFKDIDLPDINSLQWLNGFKWKGLFIKIKPEYESKTTINEIKALNYFFFDYLQIIDKYQTIKQNQLSNNLIFPLIGYSIINGQILIISALINTDSNNFAINSNIINANKNIICYYSQINKNDENNKNDDKNNINNSSNHKILLNSLVEKYYINDLLSSRLFFNINNNNLLHISNNKLLLFNLYDCLPNLFVINFDHIQKVNFFSVLKGKKIYYTLNYNTKYKSNINSELSKYKTPKEVFENLYNMNIYSSSLTKKDIIINNIHFRIIYQKEENICKNISSRNFVDHLLNYNNKENYNSKNYISEPYVIIYDLINPIKLENSLIKPIKNNSDHNDNELLDKIFYLSTNYLSYFMSWCKCLNKNTYNIKNYSDLKHFMKKYGINSQLLFFSLVNIDNSEITDIIKINFLTKAIKFVFNYKENQNLMTKINDINNQSVSNSIVNNIDSLEEQKKDFLLFLIKSILYPHKLIEGDPKFEYIYEQLVFYINLIFFKLKLIDDYLNLGLLNIGNIVDHNPLINNTNNSQQILSKIFCKQLTGFELPKNFLIHIIGIARNKPFLFISELELKLSFILNPFIKFKSSLSIESMNDQFEKGHISLNLTHKTYSFVNGKEISGLILTKIIRCYNSYNLESNNLFEQKKYTEQSSSSTTSNNKSNNNNKNNNNINCFNKNIGRINNNINLPNDDSFINLGNEENLTNISQISSDIIIDNHNIKKLDYIFDNDKSKQEVFWSDIKNEIIIELPPICYKMNYVYEDDETKMDKSQSLFKNLNYIYNIIDKKIINEWSGNVEMIFSGIYSCSGETENTYLKSLFYLFIVNYFIDKNFEIECVQIMDKITKIYHLGGYQLSLNDLSIINLLKALISDHYVKSEEYYSKCLMLLLMIYGDPRGRNNDSHGLMQFPLWKISRKTYLLDQTFVYEYFREMYHALDYFEKKKCIFKSKQSDDLFDYSINVNKDLKQILIMNNISNDKYLHNKNDDTDLTLSNFVFDNKILDLLRIKKFNFPAISERRKNIENDIFFSKNFIIYLFKNIQSQFNGKHLIFSEDYIKNEISEEIFQISRPKDESIKFLRNNINYRKEIDDKYNQVLNTLPKEKISYNKANMSKDHLEINTLSDNNSNKKEILSAKTPNAFQERKTSTESNKLKVNNVIKGNIFSHFLYDEILKKLSYKKNIPSGIVISFGNNRHNETSHDGIDKLTLPRLVYKLKNEYVDKIFSGWEHNIILNNDGEIFCFGHNNNLQCGLPNKDDKNPIIRDPVNISKINNGLCAISAACGNEHSLILGTDKCVYSFGNNEDGVLGISDNTIKTYKLNKVGFGEYTDKIKAISAGTVHNLALTENGKLFSWGSSQGGQLGFSEQYLLSQPNFKKTLSLSEPTMVILPKVNDNKNDGAETKPSENESTDESDVIIEKISCGEAHSVVLSNKKICYSWGFGSNGQLGLGICEDIFPPGTGLSQSRKFTPQIIDSVSKYNIIDIQCGKTFTMFINCNNELFACGVNDLKQLGIQEMPNRDKLYDKELTCYDFVYPTKLTYLDRMKVERIACGEGHCLAIIKDQYSSKRLIWSWGNNKFGQLGHGINVDLSWPRPIPHLSEYNQKKFADISCGGFHSLCLIKHNNNLDWIKNDYENKIIPLIKSVGII